MAQKSTKAQEGATIPLTLKFDGGLNFSDAPGEIADNELVALQNYVYNSQTGTPEVRPGTSCQTAAKCDGTNPILKIYYYEQSSSQAWLVAACGGNLYRLSGASLDGWTLIGALTNSTTVPSFLTFHAKLLIADGGQHIRTWDGTTYTVLADGLYADAITSIKGRVVVNSNTAGATDLVTFSGKEDETMWNTADLTNPAIALRAGFGDNMEVNGFAIFGDDLIVSKKGESAKKLYRINIADATPANWFVQIMTENNCAQNAHTLIGAFNNVFFIDTNGFKSIRGVTEYGDLEVDLIGARINTLFSGLVECDEISYIPRYTALWFLQHERVFCYHRVRNISGNFGHAFTDIYFQQGRIRSVCQAGDVIYLAGQNGYLYTLDLSGTLSTDEVSPGVTEIYTSALKSKQFSFFGEGILKRTEIYLTPVLSGTARLYVATPNNASLLLKTITLTNAVQLLYDATGYLYNATDDLYDSGFGPWRETSWARCRGGTIQFHLTSQSGRVGVEGLRAEIALVEG